MVNISSEMTIKNPHGKGGKQAPGSPDDEGNDDNAMQDFFNRFFGGQGGQGGQMLLAHRVAKTCASARWVRA